MQNSIIDKNIDFITEQKIKLRKKIKSELAVFCSDKIKKTDADKKIASVFLQSEYYKNASLILFYISTKTEVSTDQLIKKALQDKKTVLVPRVIPQTQKMDFYFLQDEPLENQTQIGSFGIREPNTNLKKFCRSLLDKNSLVVVPGLCFSKDGARLGKGKGFYDIFFEEFSFVKKVGLCYSIQLKEKIPCQKTDVKVDAIFCQNDMSK